MNIGQKRIMERNMQHTQLCGHTLKVLQGQKAVPKRAFNATQSSKEDIHDDKSQAGRKDTNNGALNLNINEIDRAIGTPEVETTR